MPDLSPEVKKLLSGAESLFEALKRAKPTQALAVAIRDNIQFSKLQDPEILVMCAFYKEIEKLAVSGAEVAAAPANGQPPVNGTIVKAESVEAPGGKASHKRDPKKVPDSTT